MQSTLAHYVSPPRLGYKYSLIPGSQTPSPILSRPLLYSRSPANNPSRVPMSLKTASLDIVVHFDERPAARND